MPPRKRPAGKAPSRSSATRPKRARPSELREVQPPADNNHNGIQAQPEIRQTQGTVSLDVNTLSTTISAVVSQALQSALSQDNLATMLKPNGPTTENTGSVEQAINDDALLIMGDSAGTSLDVPLMRELMIPNPAKFSPVSLWVFIQGLVLN